MFRKLAREALSSNWAAHRARSALPCALAIAVCLLGSLAIGRPAVGMVMAGGALPVGFGAFQTVGRSRMAPMLWGTFGITLAALGSSLAPHTYFGLGLVSLLAGFLCGLLASLGTGTAWVGLQVGVAALVASGYPIDDATQALLRAALLLAGGLLQAAVVLLFWRLHAPFSAKVEEDTFAGVGPALRRLGQQLTSRSEFFRYGVHLALTLCLGALLARYLGLGNGYWVPMTALLVLRTDAQQTVGRGVARILGTLVGAGLATLLAASLHPNPLAIGFLVAVFAWLCYSLVAVNYGIFAVCLTSYIAFLLAFGGLSTKSIVLHRVANTALGGGLALFSYAPQLWQRSRATSTAPAEEKALL